MEAKRFSKKVLIRDLQERADRTRKDNKFDGSNGTAQLWPKGCDEKTKELIDRAVSYGRWRTLHGLAIDVECGSIGAP